MRLAFHLQPQPQVTEPHRVPTMRHGIWYDLFPRAIVVLSTKPSYYAISATQVCERPVQRSF